MVRSYAAKIPIYSTCALHDSMLQISIALEHLHEQDSAEEGVGRRPSMAKPNLIKQNLDSRRRLCLCLCL